MQVISNGSKWLGQEPDTIDELISVLERETLDPTFERYGRFFYRRPTGEFCAFGNFLTRSHVFNVTGSLDELLPLARALKAARRRPEYIAARAGRA